MAEEEKSREIPLTWSPCLEVLAQRLWKAVESTPVSPFDRIGVIVNDPATERWLKREFLFGQAESKVLLNVEFIPLPEFLNDYLAALVHDTDPRRRRASRHPYSPAVLTWRIYRLLGESADERLRPLREYVGDDGDPKRRYTLAGKLARLYDDYQNARFQMLRDWERGDLSKSSGVPEWQTALYGLLASEDPATYARDYESAFQMPDRLPRWFRQYRALHVFDVPFMHEPMLRLLEKVARVIPLHLWCFNPQQEWLAETPSIREAVRRHRRLLQEGTLPPGETPLFDVGRFYDSPEERLFGALASGARAVLWNLCNDVQGNVEVPECVDPLEALKHRTVELHSCRSPRRELEAVRDGLCRFFKENPGVSARDAVILCADWARYAPIVDSVFGTGTGGVPVALSGSLPGGTPFVRSLLDLLAFRSSRFEVSAVFALLSVPVIRDNFGLDADAVEDLRDLVKNANVHWGYDDEEVRRLLEATPGETFPGGASFTWKRGLERLVAGMLYGFPEEEETLLDAGQIRRLRPCGGVEGGRAGSVSSLWRFIEALHRLRETFAPESSGSVAEQEEKISWLLKTFFADDARTVRPLISIRQAVRGVAESMTAAGVTEIGTGVFAAAVEEALSGIVARTTPAGNAVAFMPLTPFTAAPHRFVWICGLNDGTFPPVERRPSYDLIGRHPSFFDATARERGAFALLKAVLGTRGTLALSFVGCDARSGEKIPPSVLLSDLQDYFETAGVPARSYVHPMHAFSRRYFEVPAGKKEELPPVYSPRDEAVARLLRERPERCGTIPFPLQKEGPTVIDLGDLAEFFSAPSAYLLSSHGAKAPAAKWRTFYDRERLDVSLPGELRKEIALTGRCCDGTAAAMVETGRAPDEASASESIDEAIAALAVERKLTFSKADSAFDAPAPEGGFETFARLYARFCEANPADPSGWEIREFELPDPASRILVHARVPHLLAYLSGERPAGLMLFFDEGFGGDPARNRAWIHHLGVNAAAGPAATLLFGSVRTGQFFPPIEKREALRRLQTCILAATRPLPPDYPRFEAADGADLLPEELQQQLWSKADLMTTRQKPRKKGGA